MLDIKFLRENPEAVKENIKNKFQEDKLPLVDEVIALDKEYREAITEADRLRADRNRLSKEIGGLMAKGKGRRRTLSRSRLPTPPTPCPSLKRRRLPSARKSPG